MSNRYVLCKGSCLVPFLLCNHHKPNNLTSYSYLHIEKKNIGKKYYLYTLGVNSAAIVRLVVRLGWRHA